MRFSIHPMAGKTQTIDGPISSLDVDIPAETYIALTDKYSFIVMHQHGSGQLERGWYSSWQDRYNGGSASNTREGPFPHRHAAEANCRHTLKQLERKN
jgi:hypothetical protein